MPNNPYLVDDFVEVTGFMKTSVYLGGRPEALKKFEGVKGHVTRVYSDSVQIDTIPYTWLIKEVKLVHRDPKPEWVEKVKKMGEAKRNSHPLRYCLYQSNRGCPPYGGMAWTTGG